MANFGHVVGSNLAPFLIGIYVGAMKPRDINEYMGPFCDEVERLQVSGVKLDDGEVREIRINAFITDTPARSFLTGTNIFSYKHGCHRCNQETKQGPGNKRFFESTVDENK